MLPCALTSFPRPSSAAVAAGESSRSGRCYGMSSAVPGSPSPPTSGGYSSSAPSAFRVGSPGGSGSALSTSPGGSQVNGIGSSGSYGGFGGSFGGGGGSSSGYGSGLSGGGSYSGSSPSSSFSAFSSMSSASGVGNAPGIAATVAPDPHAQKAVVEQLLERTLSEGDFWYVVVAEWLEHLKKYLGIASTRKYYQKRVTTLPGPIVTRRDFAHTVDVVHEDAWRMLVQWYGLSEGHKPMRLVVYRYARGPEIEHNVNTFKLMLTTSPPEDFHNVRFSKMEKVGHVEWRVRQLYHVPETQESRLWARADPDSEWRPVLARDKCVGRVLDMDSDFTRPVLALELLEEDGVWGHPPEGALDSLLDLHTMHGDTDPPSALPQDFPLGPLYEHGLFDDITTAWEVDIHDQIDGMGKAFLERLHSNFAVFVQRARDYVAGRETHLRERERQISARETVTERLASRLEEKEQRLTAQLNACEEKITDYERRRLELEREMSELKEAAEQELQAQKDAVRAEAKALELDREAFSQEKKKMAELHAVQEGRVKLDIGGHQFTTSVLTLTKEADSMLAAMFSGRHALKTEADGSFFIDRDGTHFRHVLNYLRDGNVKDGTLPCSEAVLRELLTEAEYFQLSGLADIITTLLFKACSGKEGDTFV